MVVVLDEFTRQQVQMLVAEAMNLPGTPVGWSEPLDEVVNTARG